MSGFLGGYHQTVYAGVLNEGVYRSTNGTSWTAISPDLTRGPGIAYGTLTSIDSSPFDGQVVWAGSDDGLVHVTVDGGGAWTDVSDELPDRWVTSVRTSPHARETAYVTISGFRWGEPLPHVFRTTDLGASWTPIGGNLPEAPANDIIVDPLDPNRLFVATDVGVYETYDGGAVWMTLGSNLPNVVVTQLAFDPVARRLTAATYGRSFFSYDIDQPSGMESPIAEDRPGARALAIYPNPARGGASIRWRAAQGVVARVEIFTVSGRRIWEQDGEGGSLRWDGRDAGGRCVAPGTYFVRVRAGGAAVLGRGMLVVAP